jgi:hypothetical protein
MAVESTVGAKSVSPSKPHALQTTTRSVKLGKAAIQRTALHNPHTRLHKHLQLASPTDDEYGGRDRGASIDAEASHLARTNNNVCRS